MKDDLKKRYIDRLTDLIKQGELLRDTYHKVHRDGVLNSFEKGDDQLFFQWRSKCLSPLEDKSLRVFREEYIRVSEHSSQKSVINGLGVIIGLKDTIENDFIETLSTQIQISTYADFLDLAEQYLEVDNKDFAAVAVSIALEDAMKKIASRNNIGTKDTDDISVINQKLGNASVYTRIQQRKIEVYKKIRDYALHAQWGEFQKNDVKEMIQGVNNLLEYYLQ